MLKNFKNIDKVSFCKLLEWLKSKNTSDPDWPLFIDLIRFPLLSIVAMDSTKDLRRICFQPSTRLAFKQRPLIGRLAFSFAQESIAAFQQIRSIKYRKKGQRCLYFPPHNRFFLSVKKYLTNNSILFVTDRLNSFPELKLFPLPEKSYDRARIENTFLRLSDLLSKCSINSDDTSYSILKKYTESALRSIDRAQRFFDAYSIDGLVLDGDSWLPLNALSSIAKERGIPVLCIQHGLDCEHWCLDEAFSKYYSVWGEERKTRYRQRSDFQPDFIFVTGNPLFDLYRPPEKVSKGGKNWLLLTRPHSPEKCYEPSRYPEEGADVLRRVIKAIEKFPGAQLVIRPHPKDNVDRYIEVIAEEKVGGYVAISNSSNTLYDEIQRSDVVFAEDSTSGMEAMIFEKPLVHVSACTAGPVLPFVDYGAALPGFSDEQLLDSLPRLLKGLDCKERLKMHKGQMDFLHDYCGELDGKAGRRVAAVIRSIL